MMAKAILVWFLVIIVNGAAFAADAKPHGATQTFRDCADCPEMVVVPAGSFTMGSPESDPDRRPEEMPQRGMNIPNSFAISRYDVTRAQYAIFVRETNRAVAGDCYTDREGHGSSAGGWKPEANVNWQEPGFPQGDDHPVVCVSWYDAHAYVDWLNSKTSGGYRLLSEVEWEYAARAGTTTAFPWGTDANKGCAYHNGADATAQAASQKLKHAWVTSTCSDGAIYTAKVGTYRPNPFGLYDMLGNVWVWTEDCYTEHLDQLPADGTPYEGGACEMRTNRGGGWDDAPQLFRSAFRGRNAPVRGYSEMGIRVAKTLNK
jgi:formylglycine-generating enzyme required for sulfatase activity